MPCRRPLAPIPPVCRVFASAPRPDRRPQFRAISDHFSPERAKDGGVWPGLSTGRAADRREAQRCSCRPAPRMSPVFRLEPRTPRFSDASTRISCVGPNASTSGCGATPPRRAGSWSTCSSVSPDSSPIGDSARAPTAGRWEPGESRGSRRVLREPGGATPPGHAPGCLASAARDCIWLRGRHAVVVPADCP
jgi:hypothetical protein